MHAIEVAPGTVVSATLMRAQPKAACDIRLAGSDSTQMNHGGQVLFVSEGKTNSSRLSDCVFHRMVEQGRGGRIVNVASRAAYRGDSPQHWHYAASKAGMIGMTKSIARGYAAENVLIYAVCPGFTVSEMTEDYLTGRGGAQILADIPLGRVAMPEEIATMTTFCVLDAPPSMTVSGVLQAWPFHRVTRMR